MEDSAQPTTTNDWIAKAQGLLQYHYDCILLADGPQTQFPTFAVEPSLDPSEAEYFVRGIEEGIFSIDNEGYVQSSVLPPPSHRRTQKRILQLFWRRFGRRYLFREGVCQVATVAELTLKYGWPLKQIKMEPTFPELPRLAFAVDIALMTDGGRVVALCEVKRNDREMDQLLNSFRHCCAAGPHRRNECRFRKNHPKYQFCSAFEPSYFLAASPGRTVCWKLSYRGGVVIQEEFYGLLYRGSLSNE